MMTMMMIHLGHGDAPTLKLHSGSFHLGLKLLAMLAPRSVEPDHHQIFRLRRLGEVVLRELQNDAWRWRPVWVSLLPHVFDNLPGGSATVIVAHLDALPEEHDGGEALDEVLLGELDLLGGVHLRQVNLFSLQSCGCLHILRFK